MKHTKLKHWLKFQIIITSFFIVSLFRLIFVEQNVFPDSSICNDCRERSEVRFQGLLLMFLQHRQKSWKMRPSSSQVRTKTIINISLEQQFNTNVYLFEFKD